MARPKKQTVEYFPHYCDHGKTMFILESRYGNDGYTCWFKILELLGKTERHYLDCSDPATWEFLQVKTRLSEQICLEIINLMAQLGSIDQELWSKRIIWSQGFVDNLADLYARRKVELPTKDVIGLPIETEPEKSEIQKQKIWCRNATNKAIAKGILVKGPCQVCGTTEKIEAHHSDYSDPLNVTWLCQEHHLCIHTDPLNGVNDDINPDDPTVSGVNDDINPQRKVKESKVNNKIPLPDSPSGEKVNGRNYGREFSEIFYPAYPRKVSRAKAQQAYLSLGKRGRLPPVETLLAALEEQKTWPDWTKDGGNFIPYPSSWLNAAGWENRKPEISGRSGGNGKYAGLGQSITSE